MSTEKTVAREVIAAALAKGWVVSVHDGVEWALSGASSVEKIMTALNSTGADRVVFYAKKAPPTLPSQQEDDRYYRVGMMLLIWGNDPSGEELIADHSDNDAINALWNETVGKRFGM